MYNERKNCEILIFKIRGGGVVFLSRFKIAYAVVVFKILENLVEFKPFETLDKRLFFRICPNCLMHKLSVNDIDLCQKVSFGACFEGLKPNQILRNFAHQYNIRHVF